MTIDETGLRRTRRAGGRRRQEVLDVVVDVLIARGYEHARFRDVSEASGVAISTLQGYFGSREDMLVEALRRATSGEVGEMERLLEGVEDPWQQLVTLVDRGLSTPLPVWRMLMEFWTAAAHDDELCEHAAWLARRYREPFAATMQRGIDAGTFAPRHDPAAIIDVAVATMDGRLYPLVLDHRDSSDAAYREVVLAQLAGALEVDA